MRIAVSFQAVLDLIWHVRLQDCTTRTTSGRVQSSMMHCASLNDRLLRYGKSRS